MQSVRSWNPQESYSDLLLLLVHMAQNGERKAYVCLQCGCRRNVLALGQSFLF